MVEGGGENKLFMSPLLVFLPSCCKVLLVLNFINLIFNISKKVSGLCNFRKAKETKIKALNFMLTSLRGSDLLGLK